MALVVGFWSPCEASGNQDLGLAEGIPVGVSLVCFTFLRGHEHFGSMVCQLLEYITLHITVSQSLAVCKRDHADRDSRSRTSQWIFRLQHSGSSNCLDYADGDGQDFLDVFLDLLNHGFRIFIAIRFPVLS